MYGRCDINRTFMDMLTEMSKRSTCARIKTACLLVKKGRIVSSGYNGVESGMKHCIDHWNELNVNCSSLDFRNLHLEYSKYELHAEANAINFCLDEINDSSSFYKDVVLYTLYSPCIACAELIVKTGIKKVICVHIYDRGGNESIEYLKRNGVSFESLPC
jgi:dCMP deaminase